MDQHVTKRRITMHLSPEEAKAALATVQVVQDRTYRAISWGAIYEVLWGAVWVIGFLISQFVISHFVPTTSEGVLGWVWGVLGTLGGGLSIILGIYSSRQQPMRQMSGSWFDRPEFRVGLFFWALIIYSGALFALFVPLLLHSQTSPLQYGEQLSVWWVATFMFGYVVIGLWFRLRQIIGVGIVVTAIALLGYYLLPDYYWLIMALFGGGTLLGHGLLWLRPRRS
jgi:MFS family permease